MTLERAQLLAYQRAWFDNYYAPLYGPMQIEWTEEHKAQQLADWKRYYDRYGKKA